MRIRPGPTALERAALLLAPLVLAWATAPAPARAQDVPAELRGRLSLRVTRCEPHPGGSGLRVAELELATGATEVRVPGLRCGAYRPGSDDALFLERVPLAERIDAHQTVYLRSIFPADATHTECRCSVAAVERLRARPAFDEGAEEEDALPQAAPRAGPDEAPGAGPDEASWPGAGMRRSRSPLRELLPWLFDADAPPEAAPPPRLPPPAADVLRRERVLVPRVELRDAPAGAALGTTVAGGDEVDVIGLRGGWKQIRVPASGALGWILDDASTADTAAPERLAARLRRLDPYLDPSRTAATDHEGLCQAVDAESLGDLVFALLPEIHAVFVTSLWWTLEPADRDAFQVYVGECFEVRRIVDVASGADLRDLAWGEGPGSGEPGRVSSGLP